MRKSIWKSLEDLRDYGAISLKQQNKNIVSKEDRDTELMPNSPCCQWKLFSYEALGGSESASMVFGIAFHYFLEGINLGLQTDKTTALTLFMAILIHGCIMALAISITLGKVYHVIQFQRVFFISVCCMRVLGELGIPT